MVTYIGHNEHCESEYKGKERVDGFSFSHTNVVIVGKVFFWALFDTFVFK